MNIEALSSPNEWNKKQKYTGMHVCTHTQKDTLTHKSESRLLVHASMEAENGPTSTSWKAGVLPTKYQPKPEVGG